MIEEKIKEELNEIKNLLLQNKKVLTINGLAKYTGYSKSHIYKLTCRNSIPYFKPSGKIIFFNKEEIDNWLLRNKQESVWTESNTL